MTIRNILLMAFGVMILNTTTHAALTAAQCQTQCTTKDACRFAFKRKQCESDCKDVFSPDSCSLAPTKPLVKTAPVVPLTSPQRKASQQLVSEPQPGNVAMRPPSATTSSRPLPQTPEQIFINFNADLSSTLRFAECISKTITIKPAVFEKNIFQRLHSRIMSTNKLSFNNYAAYLEAMSNYYASLISPYLIEQISKFSKKDVKANQYPLTFKEFLERTITIAHNIATQIPGYRPTPSGSFISTLPEQPLNNLRQCGNTINFTSSELNSFKNDFLLGMSQKKVAAGLGNVKMD